MISTSRLGRAGRLLRGVVGPGAVADTLGRLKGGAQKLGQTAALVADGMPPELRKHFGALFAAAEPRPWAEIAPVLQELPAGLLADVEPVAFAAASLGQVHRGRLHDGREVAVKVLYPGVGDALRADLDNLSAAALPARVVRGGSAMLVGLRASLLDELDLRKEAAHAEAIARALEPWPALHVARPVASTERVLVSELLHGPTLHAVLRPEGPGPREPAAVAELLVAAVFGPVFRAGILNADAHPGNLILTEGGLGLGLVDFGAVAPVDDVPGLARGLDAFLAGRGTLEGLGIHAAALEAELLPMLRPLGPGAWDFAHDDLLERMAELKRRRPLAVREVPFAPGRLPVVRAVLGLHHALRRLGVPFALGESLARVRVTAGT